MKHVPAKCSEASSAHGSAAADACKGAEVEGMCVRGLHCH
jgi:hypothetical protein